MPTYSVTNEQNSLDGLGDTTAATGGKPAFVTLVLLPSNHEDGEATQEKQYALVRFPESYQDALRLAVTALGSHMSGFKAENIDILLPIRDKDDRWIWAEINPTDWHLALQTFIPSNSNGNAPVYRGEIGIRNRPLSKTTLDAQVSEWTFTAGLVVFTYGYRKKGTTEWTEVNLQSARGGMSIVHPTIDRPRSYSQAIEFIQSAIGPSDVNLFSLPLGVSKITKALHAANQDIHRCRFKFYSFSSERNGMPTTDFWKEIPEEAENDENLWREFVPKPHQILGFTLHE